MQEIDNEALPRELHYPEMTEEQQQEIELALAFIEHCSLHLEAVKDTRDTVDIDKAKKDLLMAIWKVDRLLDNAITQNQI